MAKTSFPPEYARDYTFALPPSIVAPKEPTLMARSPWVVSEYDSSRVPPETVSDSAAAGAEYIKVPFFTDTVVKPFEPLRLIVCVAEAFAASIVRFITPVPVYVPLLPFTISTEPVYVWSAVFLRVTFAVMAVEYAVFQSTDSI